MDNDGNTVPCPPPHDIGRAPRVWDPIEHSIMALPAGAGTRRETTAQRDARERGEKLFNARGCK